MKKIVIILVSVLSTISYKLYSQEVDSLNTLVYLHEVTFHSELEKAAFLGYFQKNEESFFRIFLSKDKELSELEYDNYADKFDNYISQLKNDKNYTKKNKKKIKYYFKKVHNDYLVKYERNIFFPSIFKNGYYNCVTGSILYGLIFEKLDIPYTVKVSPIHTYVIAYPQSESIMVESTAPIKGYLSFSDSFKERYVKYLKENKLITSGEYNSSTAKKLFDKYYFKEEDINLKELVGIQYYNDAIEKIQNQDFENAFYDLEKAYLFYPSTDISYLLYFCAVSVIEIQDFSDLKYVDFLYKIARYKKHGITTEHIVGEFGKITQNQLAYKGQYDLYDKIFARLYENLKDEEIRNEIAFIYNYEKARLYIRNGKNDLAFSFIEKALSIRPEHLDLQTMFIYALANKYETSNFSPESLHEITNYSKKYPALKNNNTYCNLICDAYLYSAVRGYEEEDIVMAKEYHKKFTEVIKDNKEYPNYDYNISRLYSSAAVYYFRKGSSSKAKSVIKEGLKLVPDSYELKQRLKVFN